LNILFQNSGFNVISATDGAMALNITEQTNPDLVLLDILMPKLNGFDYLEQIKSNKKFAELPIIVLSNLGGEGDINKARELGATDFLIKADTDLENILALAKKYLG